MKHKKMIISIAVFLMIFSSSVAIFVDSVTPESIEASTYTWGSRGATVREIQKRLKDWGYYTGSIDGVYGYNTWVAIRKFQQSHGLKVDGVAGPATLQKIGISSGAKTAATTSTGGKSSYSWGDRGETVRKIQQRLRDWDYYSGSVDGVYGYQTWSAVRKFQRSHGLTVDGVAGPATLAKIGISTGATTASTNADRNVYLLAAAIHGEARGEPYLGQVAVGAVIMNRVRHASFPNTIAGVIYQPGAFDAVRDGQINLAPGESAYRAAKDSLNGWDPTGGCIYYWNPATATSKWVWSRPVIKQIGKHVFAK